MIDTEKIGVGIVTYNRLDNLIKLFNSLSLDVIDELIIINDGDHFETDRIDSAYIIHNEKNIGVGKSKNIIFEYLRNKNVDHYFIIEDDVYITDNDVFKKYIQASKVTGIQHFNYAHHKGIKNNKAKITYPQDVKIESYNWCYAAFSYYSKNCIDKVGVMDEGFYNAMEHVEHTYRISKELFHPCFYEFIDISNSYNYISDYYKDGYQSVISNGSDNEFLNIAYKYFFIKYGFNVYDIERISALELMNQLQFIYDNSSECKFDFLLHEHNFKHIELRSYNEMKKRIKRNDLQEARAIKRYLVEESGSLMKAFFYNFHYFFRKFY